MVYPILLRRCEYEMGQIHQRPRFSYSGTMDEFPIWADPVCTYLVIQSQYTTIDTFCSHVDNDQNRASLFVTLARF